MKRAALVITTYNNPRFLGICLKSFENQTTDGFDIYIADDGSGPETREKIESFRAVFGKRLHHHWQEDTGYNKSRINNAVFKAARDYPVTICVDGDTIAHRRFIEDHLSQHRDEDNLLFMGRRVELGPEITAWLSEENVTRFNRGLSGRLLRSGLKGDSRNFMRAMRIGPAPLRALLGRERVDDLLGSNYSISTGLLHRINGYNEDFRAYWGEDGDLFVRARNAGACLRGSKAVAIQYHMDHPRLEPDPVHVELYQKLLKDFSYLRCANGIEKPGSD